MSPERWRQVEELYHAALEKEPTDRAAFLAEGAGGDEDLRREVESLLAQRSSRGAGLERPAWNREENVPETKTTTGLLPGARLGPYRIDALLGAGGMGRVYKAYDTRLDRLVAIKVCHEEFNERFLREARAIAALNHPHICTLHDIGPDYLVLEYVEGKSPKGPLALDNVLEYGSQICEALDAAHRRGIVHRDLKPSNILVRRGGVKVLDFGLAKMSGQEVVTKAGAVMGTPAYMPPEQSEGKEVDLRADIYSLGCVLYEMTTGERTLHKTLEPPALDRVVRTCIATDPEERWQSAREVKLALEFARQPAVKAPDVKPAARWGWAAAALVITLAAGASTRLLWRTPSFENPLLNAHFTRLTDFPGFEEDAAISPDGKFVAFLSDRDGQCDIWVSQVATGQFFNLTKGKPLDYGAQVRRIGFSGDGSQIWFGGGVDKLILMPMMGGPARPRFSDNVSNLSWSADASRIVYHTMAPGDPLFLADSTGENRRLLLAGGGPGLHHHYPAWSTDDKWIYFISGNFNENDVWRISSSGGVPERLTQMNTDSRYVVPLNERLVLFTSTDRDGSGPWLWAFDAERRTTHRISFGLEKYTSLSASSGGRRLAATVSNPSASLWSLPILDHIAVEPDVRPYPLPTVRALAPRFVGSSLFYLSSRGTGDGLWRNTQGDAFEIWRGSDGTLLEAPAPSPDGKRVGVVLRRHGKPRLCILSADGAEMQVLADSIEVQKAGSWSPDGKWIVIGGNDGAGPGLFKIPVDSGPPARLTKGDATNPVWSPDGQLIVYSGPTVGIHSPILATHPDGTRVHLLEIMVLNGGERYRFMADSKTLVYMRGDNRFQDFWSLDLANGKTRQLSHLDNRGAMRTFDITPDGRQIVFDRIRDNSDIVMIDLQAGPQK